MRLNSNLFLAVAGVITLGSCSKGFINDVKPSDGSLSQTIIFGSKIGVDNALTGIYQIMRDYIPSGAQQNMYGWKTSQFNFDMRGNDLISDPSNWWLYENNWSDNNYGRIATANRNKQIWNLLYQVINNANAIILNVPSVPAAQAERDQYIAEAKALRAYAYFNLARIYQFTYAKDPNASGVPIYTEPATGISNGNARATLKNVYALITADLEYASTTLTTNRVNKYRINKNVAQGILAEVYQEMAMSDNSLWTKALTNSVAAMATFPLTNATYTDGFNTVSNTEWMWGLQFNASQSLSYASFFGYIDPTAANTRYKDIYVNTTFVTLFSATDIRGKVFVAAPAQSTANPWKKWMTAKFKDNATFSGDYVMMRSAEMYLIQAEALAQTNQLELAKDALFNLQKARDAAAVRSVAPDAATLINEILVERRKELYGEIGVEYFDLKRFQRPLARNGNQWSLLNIPANDNRWRWQIPQAELDANKSLTTADQNPL